MPLSDTVRITPRFQRAVRIDSDLGKLESLQGFLCTDTFSRAITTICEQFGSTQQGAFTITGPFGSGKSSLLVAFASALGPRGKVREVAQTAFGTNVTRAIGKNLAPGAVGWRVVPVIGARSAPHKLVIDALERFRLTRQQPHRRRPPSGDEVLDAVRRAATNPKYRGLMLIMDELGKILEHLSGTGGDLQFFQNLAEMASRSDGRLLVIGVLHQSFDEYVGRAGRDVRDEWAKVQGRYLDIPLSVPGSEQIELLSRAIVSERIPKAHSELASTIGKYLREARPDATNSVEGHLRKCFPLHPVTACVLGAIARRRFGQNQRSLFGFLNSHEPAGFQDFIVNHAGDSSFTPDRLFDYLHSNLEPAILASPDGHRWSLAVESLERVQKRASSEHHVSVIKSIALLDLFRERSGLFGSEAVLRTLYPQLSRKELGTVLGDLVSWSVIAFRAHLSGYSLFAGSDFDVQSAMEDALTKVGDTGLKEVRSLASLRPIVAKKHYHRTGTLRWFDIDVVALSDLKSTTASFKPNGAMGMFLLVVPTKGEPATATQAAVKEAAVSSGRHLVLGCCKTAPRLLELAQELAALEFIRKHRGELAGDAVARREVEGKTAAVLAHLETEVRAAFGNTTWFSGDKEYGVAGLGGLARLGSDIADTIYHASPRIQNELLNRTRPSANAIAAQKALLKAMVLNAGSNRLGIDGFPAEGGLYQSLLVETGLHSSHSGAACFRAPTANDPAGLHALWQETDRLLERALREPVSAREIYQQWKEPPFGIREGLQPVLLVAYLMTRLDRYTIYLQNIMEADLSDLAVDLLSQDPANLTIRVYDPGTRERKLFAGVRETVATLLPATSGIDLDDIVGLARALVSIVKSQPAFSLRTALISNAGLSVRAAIRSANDPHILLHETLPVALDREVGKANAPVKDLIHVLHLALEEIAGVYVATLRHFEETLFQELGSRSDPTGLATLQERATRILGLTGDFRLEALISRLSGYTGSLADIEGIASLAANKPPRDWSDNDVNRAELECADLAQRFNRAEAFARVKGRQDGRHSVAFVVGLDRSPEVVSREFDITEKERLDVLRLAREIRALTDLDGVRQEVVLAAIAHVGADILILNQGSRGRAVANG